MFHLISLFNDNHVDNNLKEILVYVYFGSTVNNQPKTNGHTVNAAINPSIKLTIGWNLTKLATLLPCMVRVCQSNIIFHFSLHSDESLGICNSISSIMHSNFLFIYLGINDHIIPVSWKIYFNLAGARSICCSQT